MLAEALSCVNAGQHTGKSYSQSALSDSLYPPAASRKISLREWRVLRDTRSRIQCWKRVRERWLALRAYVI